MELHRVLQLTSGKNNRKQKAFSLHVAPRNGLRGFLEGLVAGTVSVYRCEWLSVIECKYSLALLHTLWENQEEEEE